MNEMRKDLEEAFTDDVEDVKSEIIEPLESEPLPDQAELNLDGSEEESPEESEAAAPEEAPVSEGDQGETSAEAEPAEPVAADDAGKPPLGWAADAREEWGNIPAAAREQIDRREKEMAQAMAHTSEAKRLHAEMSNLSQTYGSVMAAEGASTPLEAINGLMQTVSQLRLGSPAQKAAKMAGLIQHYGIDISALDSALVGEEATPSPTSEFEHVLDQRLAPVNQMMSELASMQQNKGQETQAQAQTELNEFAASKDAEFLNDVRNDMADLLDLAQARGQDMSLKQAYDKACAIHPTVSQVLEARKQAEVAKKRAASSSIVGSGQNVSAPKEESISDTLRRAWGD